MINWFIAISSTCQNKVKPIPENPYLILLGHIVKVHSYTVQSSCFIIPIPKSTNPMSIRDGDITTEMENVPCPIRNKGDNTKR